eukprot:5976239-Pleurochrysis_carterae.AAC.1
MPCLTLRLNPRSSEGARSCWHRLWRVAPALPPACVPDVQGPPWPSLVCFGRHRFAAQRSASSCFRSPGSA